MQANDAALRKGSKGSEKRKGKGGCKKLKP